GASGTCWLQLGGASGMPHRTGVVMAPRRGSSVVSDAAARHVVGSEVWPQSTLESRLDKVLLDGYNRSTKMKLNDLLWSYFGGRTAVDERLQCDDGGVCSGAG
ncbi:retrotransposon hot spot (RHS) protein, partial [Trypanosoma cruzi]